MSARRRHQRDRGGKDGHEPRARIQTRELRALELSIQGSTQRQIAEELGVSQPAVSKILSRLEDRYAREVVAGLDRHRAKQTLRLEHHYSESMRAWQDSKQDSTIRRQRKGPGAAGQGGTSIAELIVENQHGDPRYLEQARKALNDIRKVWGIDAPQQLKVTATPSSSAYDAMSEEALREAIEAQRQLLLAGGPAKAAGTHDES
jgi:DNA-binding CsgD family transcriptional regulator